MRKNVWSIVLVAALSIMIAIPAAAGPGGQARPAAAQGPKVKTVVSVEGVITAIDEGRSTVTIRVLTPGHQRQVGSSTMTVVVQSGTDVNVSERERGFGRNGQIRDLRVGDKVHVEAIRLDNGQFLATRVVVQNREGEGTQAQTAQGQVEFQGVVIDKGNRSLQVRVSSGRVRTVLVTSTTDIRGRVNTFREIRISDVVNVSGTLNADGSVVARRIDVLRSSASPATGAETKVTGTILAKNSTAARFLILSTGQAVTVSENTQIMSGGRLRSFDDLKPGMTITVFGSPITVGGLTVGINAWLITY